MPKRFILVLSLMFSCGADAHIIQNKSAKLVPIPELELPYGPAGAAASRIAAESLIASLGATDRSAILFDIDSADRRRWSNLPAGIFKRVGLSVGEMTTAQQTLLFQFLSSALGREGYQRVSEIMAAEAFLSRDRNARRFQWAPENYWISFYGIPSRDERWGWRFGGHHLAINISVNGDRIVSLSPSFVGTEPASFELDGVEYRVLVGLHEAGYAVYESLSALQKDAAGAGPIPRDIVTGPGEDGFIPRRVGLSANSLNDHQRTLLMSAISKWVHLQPDENANLRMTQLAHDIEEIHFAWSGNNIFNEPAYMRIQGPSLIIEMLSTGGNVGENAIGRGHYHTIYRNPVNEYGGQLKQP